MILLQANQVARHFGSETLFENIHLEIALDALNMISERFFSF